MAADFWTPLGLGAGLWCFVLLVEQRLQPRPALCRSPIAWTVQTGLILMAYALLLLLLARPFCAAVATGALIVTLVLVSNAKMHSLREPFIAQDYEYFLDTLRHPRLFLPFLGVQGFLLAAAGFVLAACGLMLEQPPSPRWLLAGQGGALALTLFAASCCLFLAWRHPLPASFEVCADLRKLGLLPAIWAYAWATRSLPDLSSSPFAGKVPRPLRRLPLPHLIAVQSESFFDARPLYAGIDAAVLRHFDCLRREAAFWGRLRVPAWGANTVRTEFAFLSGVAQDELGVHRFNPYNMIAAGHPTPAMPLYLKGLGYRTLCIHPYAAHFYKRDRVFAAWRFDGFWDIRHFAQAHRYGAYVTDLAVARAILEALAEAQDPLFIYAITMENHGPLALEPLRAKDSAVLYQGVPPPWHADLTRYLRHLRHADQMAGTLRDALVDTAFPVSLCWFGDHVPIMPEVYAQATCKVADTDCLVWRNPADWTALGLEAPSGVVRNPETQEAHRLALHWLQAEGLWLEDRV